MRLTFIVAGFLIAQSFGGLAMAASLDAYQCILSLNRSDADVKSSAFYMVLDSGLGSGLDAGAVGEFSDSMINFRYGYGDIVARLYVQDTFQYPSRYKITLGIVEVNGVGEERELASSTFRRGDPNYGGISVQSRDNTIAIECHYLALNK